jgi:hypothetical protein
MSLCTVYTHHVTSHCTIRNRHMMSRCTFRIPRIKSSPIIHNLRNCQQNTEQTNWSAMQVYYFSSSKCARLTLLPHWKSPEFSQMCRYSAHKIVSGNFSVWIDFLAKLFRLYATFRTINSHLEKHTKSNATIKGPHTGRWRMNREERVGSVLMTNKLRCICFSIRRDTFLKFQKCSYECKTLS